VSSEKSVESVVAPSVLLFFAYESTLCNSIANEGVEVRFAEADRRPLTSSENPYVGQGTFGGPASDGVGFDPYDASRLYDGQEFLDLAHIYLLSQKWSCDTKDRIESPAKLVWWGALVNW